MVACVLAVGRGVITLQRIEDLLNKREVELLPVKFARVPPEALYLKRVHYCDDG